MAIEVYDDPILDWDDIAEDLALLEASEADDGDDRLHIDWETPHYRPALGIGGMHRALLVYGTAAAWNRRDEAQWRLDVEDATCRPAVIR